MTRLCRCLAIITLGTAIASAQDVIYVTDLSIFTVLAPCAASAVSYNVQSQTYANCPEDVDALQSCVCTKNNNFASISKAISQSISYSCGGTASDDQASAATVFDAYCNQDQDFSFPEPATPVSQFITDLPAFDELAPCAATGLAYVVQSMTYDLCPGDPSHLATCVCNKNQNSLLASQDINQSIRYSCASNTADISSAQAVFAGYCGLNNGTSSFPTTSDPPGDMTYYITALDEYSALAPCAQSAVSYDVFSQTYDYCPGGPQALASCVCLKDGMSRRLTNMITSSVKYSCASTASEDISSAIEVFEYYCSAAKALVTPAGITETASQTAESGNTASSGPTETAGPTSDSGDFGIGGSGTGDSGPSESTTPDGSSSGSSNGNGGSSGNANTQPASTNTGVIVGAVVGVVGGLALIGGVIFFFWRRSRKAKTPIAANDESDAGAGKPELDNNTALAPVSPPSSSPTPSALKAVPPSRADNVSPISAHNTTSELSGQPPAPQTSELHGQWPGPQMSELHAQGGGATAASRPELQGQNSFSTQATASQPPYSPAAAGRNPQEAFSQQVYEAPVQHPAQVHEMHAQSGTNTNWQSGPVSQYHEMDGGSHQPRGS